MLLLEPGKTLVFHGGILLGPSGGIEAGILLRNAGTGPGEPGIEGGAECFHPFHFPGGEIALFPGVPGEVVEFVPPILVVVDEFPIPAADDGAGFTALVAIVRVVPEEVTRGNGFALEEGNEAHPVDVLGGEGIKARQFEESGIEVGSRHRDVAGCPGSGHARSLDVVGFADPALPLAPLAAAVGQVAGGKGITRGNAAVVGGENHDGVVRDAHFVEGLEDDAHRVIHAFHHAGIDGTILDLAHGEGAVEEEPVALVGGLAGLVPVLLPEPRGGLDGSVDRVEGEEGKEGSAGLGFDESSGVGGEAEWKGLSLGAILHLGIPERGEEAPGGTAPVVSADVPVKSVILRE